MDPFLAEIVMFGGNFAPRGWAFCDGQLLPISQYSALFSILGTTYGGDGRTTFALPDMRGRAPLHPGNGPGLSSRKLGAKGGSETNTLNSTQLPSHSHTAAGTVEANVNPGAQANTGNPGGSNFAFGTTNIYNAEATNQKMAANNVAVTVNNTGGGQSVNNMQPWLAVNFIIALQGVFPSRS